MYQAFPLLAEGLGTRLDKGKLGKLGKFLYRYVVVMCMVVIVAPSIVVDAWSMAFLLGQHVEYYLLLCYSGLLKVVYIWDIWGCHHAI